MGNQKKPVMMRDPSVASGGGNPAETGSAVSVASVLTEHVDGPQQDGHLTFTGPTSSPLPGQKRPVACRTRCDTHASSGAVKGTVGGTPSQRSKHSANLAARQLRIDPCSGEW
jgi:hypothetical protein